MNHPVRLQRVALNLRRLIQNFAVFGNDFRQQRGLNRRDAARVQNNLGRGVAFVRRYGVERQRGRHPQLLRRQIEFLIAEQKRDEAGNAVKRNRHHHLCVAVRFGVLLRHLEYLRVFNQHVLNLQAGFFMFGKILVERETRMKIDDEQRFQRVIARDEFRRPRRAFFSNPFGFQKPFRPVDAAIQRDIGAGVREGEFLDKWGDFGSRIG